MDDQLASSTLSCFYLIDHLVAETTISGENLYLVWHVFMMARVVLEYSEPLSNDSCHADSSDEDVTGAWPIDFWGLEPSRGYR